MLKRFVRKSQNPLSQVVKRVAELEEHALSGSYHKVNRTKYSVNKKDAWFLLTSGDFVLIEEIINEDFSYAIFTKNTIFKIYSQCHVTQSFLILLMCQVV